MPIVEEEKHTSNSKLLQVPIDRCDGVSQNDDILNLAWLMRPRMLETIGIQPPKDQGFNTYLLTHTLGTRRPTMSYQSVVSIDKRDVLAM